MSTIPTVPTEIARITGLRNDIRSRLIQVGALSDQDADLEACRDAMSSVSPLTLDSIAITTPPTKTVYSAGEAFDPTGMVVTAYFSYNGTTINFIVDDYTYPTEGLVLGTDEVTISYTFENVTKTTTQEIGTLDVSLDLDETSWETISWIAQRGLGSTYWNVGDRKAITVKGRIGAECSINQTLYVYILDFNHPENGVPDNNIIFGGFFTAKTGGVDVCLVDNKYGETPPASETTGSQGNPSYYMGMNDRAPWFNINHWGTVKVGKEGYRTDYTKSTGGWKGCDFRYDILGATENPPSGYGAKQQSTQTGYDATQAAIDTPVLNTMMSALPADFRSVLRLRTHYVDNKGGSQEYDTTGQYVTAVTDAISLLTEFEVTGMNRYAFPGEIYKQTQMAYYENGGSAIKYKHNATSSAAVWYTASPSPGDVYGEYFCCISSAGNGSRAKPGSSFGLAPVFKV